MFSPRFREALKREVKCQIRGRRTQEKFLPGQITHFESIVKPIFAKYGGKVDLKFENWGTKRQRGYVVVTCSGDAYDFYMAMDDADRRKFQGLISGRTQFRADLNFRGNKIYIG